MPARTIRELNAAIDSRVGTQKFLKNALDHIFPDNWSFMLGELAMYCFLILVLSGIYLTFFFDPSDSEVVYRGSYLPLHGQTMSLAYQSTLHLSLDVRAGLLFRQLHHWSADVFLAAIVAHLCRIFFTGAFRRPREINWLIGVTLLILSIFNGFSGYSLPGDLLSGAGLRIAYSIAESVPVVGNWIATLFVGGQFPSDQLTHRLYIAHVFLVPLLIFGLLGLHLALIWRQKHTQFAGVGRSERRLVGSQLWPTYTARSLGLFAGTAGVLVLLAGLAQINPIWLYGPYKPESMSSNSQPDWYVGWMEGALRLFPGWRLHLFGYTVSEVFWPAVVLPLATFAALYAYPFVERRLTNDLVSHNLLDRPRDRPGRTAFGAGALSFYMVLLIAGAQDTLAHILGTTQPPVMLTLRGMTLAVPPLVALVTWKVCRDLSAAGRLPDTEPPQGPNDAASPPPARYLPARARYETADGAEAPAPASPLRRGGAALLGLSGAFAAGWFTRRSRTARRPNGAPGGGRDVGRDRAASQKRGR